jgi:hypothetical protein
VLSRQVVLTPRRLTHATPAQQQQYWCNKQVNSERADAVTLKRVQSATETYSQLHSNCIVLAASTGSKFVIDPCWHEYCQFNA